MEANSKRNYLRGIIFFLMYSYCMAFGSYLREISSVPSKIGEGVTGAIKNVSSAVIPTVSSEEGEEEKKEVCFKRLGCFSLEKPWKSLLRPLPMPWSPTDLSPSLYLYTRNSNGCFNISLEGSDMSLEGSDFDPERAKTVVITHGFASTGLSEWLQEMKDAYLRNVDANIFILDWGHGSQLTNYLQVASNTRVVGAQLTRFLKPLVRNGLSTDKIHLIGHSLGAHIMAYCAKSIGEISKIRRITALDPAQPGFEGNPAIVRLASSDAINIDVIHTDAKPFIPFFGFGMLSPIGTVDFYMNGGSMQPGCWKVETPNITSIMDLLKYPVEVISNWVSCSHGRSYEYFTAALDQNNCSFCGRKMRATETFLKVSTLGRLSLADPIVKEFSNCDKQSCTVIGLDTFELPSRGSFAVTTDDDPPFCEVTGDSTKKLRKILSLDLAKQLSNGVHLIGRKLRLI